MKPSLLASPDSLSAGERAFEITTILAAAIIRSQATGTQITEKYPNTELGFLPDQRVHTTPSPRKRSS